MSIPLHIHDLPADGLILIGPLDSSFDAEVASLIQANPTELMRFIDAAKPFCVFIKNTGGNRIAGYRLKWDLTQADGNVITSWSSASNPEILSGEQQSSDVMIAGALPIRPGTTRFISWQPRVAEDLYARKRGGAAQTDGAIKQTGLDQKTDSLISATVSIDGAYFDDGSFSGPDTGSLFAETEGYIEAALDLAALTSQHRGKPAELFAKIEFIAKEAHEGFGSGRSAADYRILFRRIQAQNLLRVRDRSGDGDAMEFAQRHSGKNWQKLRRNNPG